MIGYAIRWAGFLTRGGGWSTAGDNMLIFPKRKAAIAKCREFPKHEGIAVVEILTVRVGSVVFKGGKDDSEKL